MTEHILVVGSGRELPGLLRQTGAGVATSVICRLEFLAKLRDVTGHHRVVAVRQDAPDAEWIALAAAVHALHPITRIATFGERDQDRAAAIGAALRVPTHDPSTVRWVHDKAAMRARLAEVGVDDTPAARVAGPAELAAFVAAHGTPCVVKPVRGAGSAGVAVVRHPTEVPAAFARAAGSFDGIPDAGVLVERFHEGPQYSVEAFSEGGEHVIVAVTRKFSDAVSLVELGHVVPADLAPDQYKAVSELVGQVLDGLGIRFGPTHTELVLTGPGPRLIETHVRMGGDEIPALVHDATGVDLTDHVVRQSAGQSVLTELRRQVADGWTGRYEAIWYASAPAHGTLVEIHGTEQAALADGVRAVRPLVAPGAALGELGSSDHRVAFARAGGDSADAAVDAARTAVGRLGYLISVSDQGPSTV